MNGRKLGLLMFVSVFFLLKPGFLSASRCTYNNAEYKLANKDSEQLKSIVISNGQDRKIAFSIAFKSINLKALFLPILGNASSYQIIPIISDKAKNLYSPANHDIRFKEMNFIAFNQNMEKIYDFPSPDGSAPNYIYIPNLIDNIYISSIVKKKLYDGIFVLSTCTEKN